MSESLNKNLKKKKNFSFLKKCFLGLIIIIIFSVISLYYYINQSMPVEKNNSKNINVTIPQGSTTSDIGKILESNDVIKNKYIFRISARIKKLDGKLKAGEYVFNNGMNIDEILSQLVKGGRSSKETITFTIPEGFELKQIAEKLDKLGLVNKDKFMELASKPSNFSKKFSFLKDVPDYLTLEGYLFPDTYQVYKDSNEEEIISKMLLRFNEIYNDEMKKNQKELGMNLNEVITLASIIEREAKIDSERAIISAVFHNRLKINKPLESCATVQYVLGERKEYLTYEDLKVESPYNTYNNNGLPPGPIASPGLKSIEAALNPADVDYLYFVSNGDGTHTFTKTYKDHLDAKNRK